MEFSNQGEARRNYSIRRRLLESPKLAFSDTESRISADDVQAR